MTTTAGVIAIIGPSACGKSSLVRNLHERGAVRVTPTWTTRPRRAEEVDGAPEHRFVTEQVFDELIDQGFFLDVIALFGLPHRYGLPHLPEPAEGVVDVVMLRAPLVDRFRAHVPDVRVYQVEDTPDRARARLVARRTSPNDLAARLRDNEAELALGRVVADRTFTNDTTLDDLTSRVARALAEDMASVAVDAR